MNVLSKQQLNTNKIKNAICYIFSPLFVIVTFAILLACFKVFPFGKNTISSYDLLAQIVPLIEHFYDVFSGKSSLFYSFALAGGMDTFGSLAYCVISPFTFLFLIFGKGNVYYATSLVLPLKLASITIAITIYIKKKFKNINDITIILASISYAFCGYVFTANTYINWLDLLIYIPFVELGFKKLVERGNITFMAIFISLMIYTSFSITCFSLFIIFPIMALYCIMLVPKQNRGRVSLNVILSLFTAIVISLPVLLPSFVCYMNASRRGSMFDNVLNKLSPTPLYVKMTYVASDTFALCLTIAYFFKNPINRRMDRFIFLCGLIIFAPIILDEVCLILNFGSYLSYALRFGFLSSFYMLFVSLKFLQETNDQKYLNQQFAINENKLRLKLLRKKNKIADNQPISQLNDGEKTKLNADGSLKINNVILCVAFTILVVVSCFILIILNKGILDESYTKSFSGKFAHSVGGLEVTAILLLIASVFVALGVVAVKFWYFSKKLLTIFACVLIFGQSVFYNYHLVRGNVYDPQPYDDIGKLIDYSKSLEQDDNFRVKMSNDYLTSNMPITLQTQAFSVFSSMADKRNFVAGSFFKYNGNGCNTMHSYGGTLIGDCFLGYKYLIVKDRNIAYRSFNPLNDSLAKSGDYYLLKNKMAFPNAFKVKNCNVKMDKNNYCDNLEEFVNFLSYDGKQSLKQLDLEQSRITTYDFKEKVYKITVKCYEEGNYYLQTNFPEDYDIEYCKSSFEQEKLKKLTADESLTLAYMSNGIVTVYLKFNGDKIVDNQLIDRYCKIKVLTNESLKKLYQNAMDNGVKLSVNKSTITANAVANNGEYLLLNYVNLKGHKAFVNGKQVKMQENYLNFMLIPLEKGENNIKITYQSPYVKYILIGFIIAVCYLIAYVLFVRKLKDKITKLYKIAYVTCVSVSISVVAFFYAMPVFVFLYKAIKQLVVNLISLFG